MDHKKGGKFKFVRQRPQHEAQDRA
jgi:hypothetical protein